MNDDVKRNVEQTWGRIFEIRLARDECWKCPDCESWATLGENAHAHALATGHQFPTRVTMSRPQSDASDALKAGITTQHPPDNACCDALWEISFALACIADKVEEMDRMAREELSRTERMAAVINRYPAVDGHESWACERCGHTWLSEVDPKYDRTKDKSNWPVVCDTCGSGNAPAPILHEDWERLRVAILTATGRRP